MNHKLPVEFLKIVTILDDFGNICHDSSGNFLRAVNQRHAFLSDVGKCVPLVQSTAAHLCRAGQTV